MDAPIRRVTVFRNGALVVRRGSAGAGAVAVGGLPLNFNSDTLRVRAERGTVRDVEERCSLEAVPAPPPVSEAERREVELEGRRLDDETASVDALARLFQEVGPVDAGKVEVRGMPDAGTWIALHEFAQRRLEALARRRRELEEQKRQLAERRRQLELADRGDREPPRFTRGVAFTIEGAEGPCGFEVEYFVPAARWVPTYTLHLDRPPGKNAGGNPQGDRARLSLSALVAQATGEDWRGAEVCFSSANLSRETTLPELRSWRLGREQTPRRPAFRPLPSDLETLFAGYDSHRRRHRVSPKPKTAGFVVAEEKRADADDTGEILLEELAEPLSYDEDEVAAAPAIEVGTAAQAAMAAPPPAARARPKIARRVAQEATLGIAAAPSVAAAAVKRLEARGNDIAPPLPRPLPEPLPPRLRYAYLRLVGPDQPHRGMLMPIDPLEHLWSLVEDHAAADVADLRRAVDALKKAAARLHKSPTPPGTTPLAGTSFHHVYAAPGSHDVPPDGVYHRLLVERTEAPAAVELRTVPRGGDEVYRFCRLQPAAGVPYPTGPLHVYEGDDFRVTARLLAAGGGKDLELNLGVEPALRVVGRTVDVKQQEKGVVAQKSRVEHRVRIRLRSALAEEARVVVYDRLPAPADNEKDVAVTLLESAPAAVEDGLGPAGDKLDGGLHWQLTVPPGATAEVSYRYEISLPAGSELVGGNRRE